MLCVCKVFMFINYELFNEFGIIVLEYVNDIIFLFFEI